RWAGKGVPYAGVSVVQLVSLLVVGRIAFDMHLTGSLVAAALVIASTVAFIIALGFVLVAFCSTVQQVFSIGNLTVLLAAVGGALLPIHFLPEWVQSVAVVTPQYWAMDGFEAVILRSGTVGDVLGDCA